MFQKFLKHILQVILHYLPWGLLAFGIFLRVREFLNNRSLWFDEALLGLNIVNRGFHALLRPLDNAQAAPLGFLFTEKTISKLFGNSDLALRLFPFICGIGTLLLFYWLVSRSLDKNASLLALALFAILDPLIYFSAELKQYSSDVFFATLILWLCLYITEHELSGRWVVAAAIAGGVAIWFSHPAVFVLAGAGCTLLVSTALQKKKTRFLLLLTVVSFWGINFLADYFISLHNISVNNSLMNYWASYFAPFPPTSWADLGWFFNTFIAIFKYPGGFILAGLAAVLFVFGCASLYHRHKGVFFLFISPIFFLLAASLLHKYPFGDRLVLFLVPVLLVFISEGTFFIIPGPRFSTPARIVNTGLALAILFYPIISLRVTLQAPRVVEESRSAISYIQQHWTTGDLIYVYYGAAPTFQFYASQFGFGSGDFVLGVTSRKDPGRYTQDVVGLANRNRVWLLFSHVFGGEAGTILTDASSLGTMVDHAEFPNAGAYLFNLAAGPGH